MADDVNPEFVMSQVKLAAAYKAAGDVRQAISLLEQTLAGSQRVLGDADLVTAAVRNNLAAAYRAAGEPPGLAVILGPRHLRHLASRARAMVERGGVLLTGGQVLGLQKGQPGYARTRAARGRRGTAHASADVAGR
jgi:hypothetical protein